MNFNFAIEQLEYRLQRLHEGVEETEAMINSNQKRNIELQENSKKYKQQILEIETAVGLLRRNEGNV